MEYLAGGKPVISVRIAALERYAHLAYVADSYEQFLEFLDQSLDEKPGEKAMERVEAMKHASWDSRFALVSERVRKHIPAN